MDELRRGAAGLLAQVKPTFMAPAVGMSLFGGLLAPSFAPLSGVVHALAVGTALYVAHLVDEYVDAHVRGEDRPVTSRRGVVAAAVLVSAVCLSLLGLLWVRGHPLATAVSVPLLILAVGHAPVLDRDPVAGTVGYPLGIALAVAGGYAVQRDALAPGVVAVAVVFLVALSAVKVSTDRLDRSFDRRVGKRTVPVVLGDDGARRVSVGLCVGAAGLVGALVAGGVLSPGSLLAVPLFLVAAAVGRDDSPARATRRQMALVYPIAVSLFVARCLVTGCVVVRFVT